MNRRLASQTGGSRAASTIVVLVLVLVLVAAACAPATTPSDGPTTKPTAAPIATASPTPPGASSTEPPRTPPPVVGPRPWSFPPPERGSFPVRGSARELSTHGVVIAPQPGGGLYVLIPDRNAPVTLTLLDPAGRQRSGWPVVLPGATSCDQLLPLADGSVRVICTHETFGQEPYDPIGVFAFDSAGRTLPGWPVDSGGIDVIGRIVDERLLLLVRFSYGGITDDDVGLMDVSTDGSMATGTRVPAGPSCCGYAWTIGPDGVAIGVAPASSDPSPQVRRSRITAIDLNGERAGWPIALADIASRSAFAPGGRAVVVVGSLLAKTSRVITIDAGGEAISGRSTDLAIETVQEPDTGGCHSGAPMAPVIGRDGGIVVYGDIDRAIYALDPSLATRPGWPLTPDRALVHARPGFESEHEAGYCPPLVAPAIGPDGTMYLLLLALGSTAGGRIVAIGPDGHPRAGWPVQLKRPGAEFWSIDIGDDGTVYALAIEPESSTTSSSSVLAIAPDSTVLWTTTIVDP